MEVEISSRENPKYKALKKLTKEKGSYIFIEGLKLFLEALNSTLEIKEIYVDRNNEKVVSRFLSNSQNQKLHFMKNNLLSTLFTTINKPTTDDLIIALADKPIWDLIDLFRTKKHIVFLDRIQDPGNLGTIFRSSLAFGAGGIVLTKGSLDPFNTKVIRASAGAAFSLPLITLEKNDNFFKLVKKMKYNIIAMSPHSKKNLFQVSLNSPTVFLFGNEGSGLRKELLDIADEIISIPDSPKVESINLGVAVSIVLWELYKSRS